MQYIFRQTTQPFRGVTLNWLHPLTRGLVNCWLINTGAGSILHDVTANSNHLTLMLTEPSGWSGGKMGNSFDFDGIDDYAYKSIADFRSSDSQGTISCWFRASTTAGNTIFASADESSTNYLFMVTISNDLMALQTKRGVGTTNILRGTELVNDELWHNFVVTSDGSAYVFYLDGSIEGFTAGINNGEWFSSFANRDNISVGALVRTSVAGHFNGKVSNIMVWNRPLTEGEAKKLYYEPLAMFNRQSANWLWSAGVSAPPTGIASMRQIVGVGQGTR